MEESFDKIRSYYSQFDEWGRLDSAAGMLEKGEVIRVVCENVPQGAHILDVGAGPGRFALEFAKRGYRLSLTDLSPRLIDIARAKFEEEGLTNRVADFLVGNATDLSPLSSDHYDAVLSCGPFYHLVSEKDRIAAAKEAMRVVKPGGTLLIGFIPKFSGLAGLIGRAARTPGQVTSEVFRRAVKDGVFHNASEKGFQEGYYPTLAETKAFWAKMGLSDIYVVSTRTFMHQNEGHLLKIQEEDPALFEAIIEASREVATNEAFIEAGGHALLVGKK